MFHGLFVTNAFLRTEKFLEHERWFQKAAEKREVDLVSVSNADFLLSYGTGADHEIVEKIKKYDFILFWDKDVFLGRRLEAIGDSFGIPMFNPIRGIDLCDDKSAAYEVLSRWNLSASKQEMIPLISTISAPMTYQNTGYTDTSFVGRVIDRLGLPLVIKECRGSFGMQVYLAETEEKVMDFTKKLEGVPFLYQKYIETSSGRDVRLQVVGEQVVAGMYRYSENGDFRANLSNGGRMEKYQPSAEEKELAVRTVKALGLDFAGVDLLFSGRTEQADLVCEVNSNAHFKNIFQCTGVNVADCIMEYILLKL